MAKKYHSLNCTSSSIFYMLTQDGRISIITFSISLPTCNHCFLEERLHIAPPINSRRSRHQRTKRPSRARKSHSPSRTCDTNSASRTPSPKGRSETAGRLALAPAWDTVGLADLTARLDGAGKALRVPWVLDFAGEAGFAGRGTGEALTAALLPDLGGAGWVVSGKVMWRAGFEVLTRQLVQLELERELELARELVWRYPSRRRQAFSCCNSLRHSTFRTQFR